MPRLRFGRHHLDVDVNPAALARRNEPFRRLREKLLTVADGDDRKVDRFLADRMLAALKHFGDAYLADMAPRLDRVFELRDGLADSVARALNGERISPTAVSRTFDQLGRELDGLHSPTERASHGPRPEPGPPLLPPGRDPSTTRRQPTPPSATSAIPRLHGLSGARTLEGLARLRRMPGDLRDRLMTRLERIAASAGDATARRLLQGVGRFLADTDIEALRGLDRFLEVGGDPGVLARLVNPRDPNSDVTGALGAMRHFDAEAARGVAVFMNLGRGNHPARTLRVFENFDPRIVNGVFAVLARLQDRGARGLERIVPDLVNPTVPKQQGSEGLLLAANKLLDEYPDATLRFEDPISDPSGVVVRKTDIVLERPGFSSRLRIEVKEIRRQASLGSRHTRRELANDIVSDSLARRGLPTPAGASRPFFETIRWRIREAEIRAEVSTRLGAGASEAQIRAGMVDAVKDRLRPALDHPVVQNAFANDPGELAGYRAAFEAGAFIEFF